MGQFLKRAFQLATMAGVVILGALVWRQSGENVFIEACVMGLMVLGVAGIGLSGFSAASSDPRGESTRRAAEQRFAADIMSVVRLLRTHSRANASYSDSLARANEHLPQLESAQEIRAVVLSLIEENRKIQTRMDDLSRNLDESAAKIENLRLNLAEANDKALRDPLTALGNRRFFDQKLDEAMAQTAGSGILCLVVCDLDNFKTINDKFGHPVGDMVLKLFSEILTATAQQGETVARLGGEEFAIITPEKEAAGASAIADRVRRRLESKKWVVGTSGAPLGAVTASFGIAQLRAGESAAELFRRADEALYRAKDEGRNRIVVA
ncbi:MAG: GGDEF domain-containing protein [Hyphomicrobiales bacterium]|nr:GGDEF domain-containing protein [Hyphomicrobiales bacterium]MBV8664153.1 GGDEF domain-containing protein [Hyphomicrobiales bacterium]